MVNLDDDPFAEIVYLDRFGNVYAYEHTGAIKWGPRTIAGAGHSLLTAGDLDGDGRAEIVVTAGSNIVVIAGDNSSTRSIPVPNSGGFVGGNTSIFDLNGDGKPELIHNGATGPFDVGFVRGALYVLDAQTGDLLHTLKSSRNPGDLDRGPVIADVDGDGTAEIVTGGWAEAQLLHVFKAKNGKWAQSRPIYNQFNYHVTNVNPDGTIPANPAINWHLPGMNNSRINVPLPEEEERRTDSFKYKDNDGQLDSNEATVYLEVLPPGNPPRILSQPGRSATLGLQYNYRVFAVDPDVGDVLTYGLSRAPAGMTINAATGLIQWTPGAGQLGPHQVGVTVTDTQRFTTFQAYTLTAAQPVVVPNVIGQTEAAARTTITGASLVVGATSRRNDPAAPAGNVVGQTPPAGAVAEFGGPVDLVVSLGPGPGDIDADRDGFTPNQGDCNDANPAIRPGAPDPPGDGIDQDCDGIDGNLAIASIVVEPVDQLRLVGQKISYRATAVFVDGTSQDITGIVAWESTNTAVATITPNPGVATATGAGATTIRATRNGTGGQTSLNVSAVAAGDLTPPVAAITAPAADSTITAPTDIVGSAGDANFHRYELAIAPTGETDFTVIRTGTSQVSDGVLGKFDPTMLVNDLYTVRLTVFDRGGNQTVAERTYQVDENMKIGNFSLTYTDLTIPMSGIPITVQRTYDSRDKGRGDFGFGWRLGIQSLRCRSNRVLGTAWQVMKSGLSFALVPTDVHRVSLTLPGGRVEEFDLVISPTVSPLVPFPPFVHRASFRARPGTLGTLVSLDNNDLTILDPQPGEVLLLDDGTNKTYNPQRFRYTAADGTEIVIHKVNGVESVRDPNGNTLTFTAGGIIHSAGRSVLFQRDAEGRIVKLTDPRGNTQTYTYDTNGDLTSHSDAAGNTTRYAYNRQHGLLRIVDPIGRPVTRSEYDDAGRLVAVTGANGRRVTFGHDLNNRREVTTDVDGNVTVTEYDDKGNVVRVTDPLGGVTINSYDAAGNQISTTNPLGQTTTHTFDSRRNLLSVTDPLGQTTTRTYSGRNQVTSTIDPLGRTTQFTYDSRGNLLSRLNGAGIAEETNTYDAQGNLLTRADGAGSVTRYIYSSFGDPTAQIDPRGNRQEFSYDAQGNVLSEKDGRGGVLTLTYDSRGLSTQIRDPLGNVATFAYDALAELTAATDAAGNRSERTIDALGRDLTNRDPMGNTSSREYDAKGNLIRLTTPNGKTSQFEYDALDRRIRTVFADGAFETYAYDAAGRNTARTDANGNTTTFGYDAAGRHVRTTDALGGVTRFEYDAAGNQIAQIDALGSRFAHRYDSANRRIGTTFPDGSSASIGYDGAGRKTSEVDAAGQLTRFEYDGNGNLTKVIDAAGRVTMFTYDPSDNLLTQTDANGKTTSYEYDANGRRVRVTLPAGHNELFEYDSAGNVLRTRKRSGDIVLDQFDAAKRWTRRLYPDGGQIAFTYTPAGKVASATDARGTTIYGYDMRDRVTRIDNPDGGSLAYTYDAVGNRTSVTTRTSTTGPPRTVTYTYDALNRLASVTDPSGQRSTYSYDAVGNLKSIQYPNGTSTLFTYDTLSRLTVLEHKRGASVLDRFTYTVNAVGDRTRVDALDGSFVTYSYDARRQITRETRRDTGGSVVHDAVYTLDAAGNRIAHTLNGGSAVIYVYDVNDRLLSQGSATFGYDAEGNTTSRTQGGQTTTYEYDFENRLTRTIRPGQ